MAKFLFTNWETVPFKKRSFEEQLDRYLKVCVASVDNPQKVLIILPLFGKKNRGGFTELIEVVRNHELGQDEKNPFPFSDLLKPQEGEFIEVPSTIGPLFRIFTKDEARYNICTEENVGKVERLSNGKVKIYDSIKVFSLIIHDNETGEKVVLDGWKAEDWYNRFLGFNYHPIADLTEPLQL